MSDDPDRPRSPRDRRDRPEYTVYRSRRPFLARLRRGGEPELSSPGPAGRDRGPRSLDRRGRRGRGRLTGKRVALYGLLAIVGWVALSLVLFLVSAQIEQSKVSDAANRSLDGGGLMPFSSNTILVLGSDARPKGTHEGGANVIGQPSRSDSILLIRAGGGKSAQLSIPRDTVVDIPGHGPDKINAAYAIGGPALAINTVKQYLGIDINHLVEVNFDNFPDFIDALGGVTVKTGCVDSEISGGDKNGGVTLRLRPGDNHLNGRQALALARTRKNKCNAAENDIDRAKHQQQILAAIKSRIVSLPTFFRLPWVSWTAPKAIRTDMSGPSLLGLFAALEVGGSPPTRVLGGRSIGFVTVRGGSGISVPEDVKRSDVRRFLAG